jgi:hypothetical protein
LLNLDLRFESYDLSKIQHKSVLKTKFETGLNPVLTRGALLLVRTGLAGLAWRAVGLKVDWTVQIRRYRFGIIIRLEPLDLDLTAEIKSLT